MNERAAEPVPAAAGSELHEALSRLAESQQGILERDKLIQSGQLPLAEVLLRELDEIILPRELTVLAGGDVLAVLTVAHRRLAGFTLGGDEASEEAIEDPEAAVSLFAARMRTLENMTSGRGLKIRRRACRAPAGAGNCTAVALAKAMANAKGGLFTRFSAVAEAKAEAWMCFDENGALTLSKGPEWLLKKLSSVIAANSAKGGVSAKISTRRPECQYLPLQSGNCVITAVDGGHFLLMALRENEADAALDALEKLISPASFVG